MKAEHKRNMSASVKARLLQRAKERREELEFVLTRYAAERLLYRLSRSSYRQQFILKGATLFACWTGETHRPTRDLDLLGYGDLTIAHLIDTFTAILKEPVEDDGLTFLAETITVVGIYKENQSRNGLTSLS